MKTVNPNIFENLFPFWNKIDEEDKKKFCDYTIVKTFKAGENINGRDTSCIGVIFVVVGELRAYLVSENGKEVTLFRPVDNDLCVLSASCILQNIDFDIYVDAEKDSEIYIINPNFYAKMQEKYMFIENFTLNAAVSRLSDMMWSIQQILFYSLDKRLAVFLYDEYVKSKQKQFTYTHEQIAKYIGSARETISRMLKYFASEKIVSLSRGNCEIIDLEKLKKIALD